MASSSFQSNGNSSPILSDDDFCDVNFNSSVEHFSEPSERTNILKKLMNIYLKHSLPKTALQDIAELINDIPGAKVQIPTKKHVLIKEFLENGEIIAYKHMLCNTCEEYVKLPSTQNVDLKCTHCGISLEKTNSYFVSFDLKSQLRSIIIDYCTEIFNFRKELINGNSENITDVYSGSCLKSLTADEFIYSLTINTDGVNIFESSPDMSLWPILLVCNFLPPNLRYLQKNMVVAATYNGNTKPNFIQYFDPIAQQLVDLGSNGLQLNSVNYKFFVTHGSFDLPAKYAIHQMTQYNGTNACTQCRHPGQKVGKLTRYTTTTTKYQQRTHNDMIMSIYQFSNSGQILHGVRGMSAMIGFLRFDLVKSLAHDYMHGQLLGNTKRLLQFFFLPKFKKQPFYLNPMKRRILDKRLSLVKPCRFVKRKPNSFKNFQSFKASEYRAILLYFHPIFAGILPKKYYDHFRLLSSAIYILLSSKITPENLNIADQKLQQFVVQFEVFYGKEYMTMNVHGLTHIAEHVKNLGPLWSYSLFPFEQYNGKLKKYVTSSNDILSQITTKYLIERNAIRKGTRNETKKSEILRDETKIHPSKSEKLLIRKYTAASAPHLKFFTSMSRGNCAFTSVSLTRAKKTIDYFVCTTDNKIGRVKYYFTDSNEKYALIQEYDVVSHIDHISEVKPKQDILVCNISSICDKFVYVNVFQNKEFVVLRPNEFELN